MKRIISKFLAVTLLLQSNLSMVKAEENPEDSRNRVQETAIVQKTLSTAYLNEVVSLVNEYRAQAGIPALTTNPALTAAAGVRAEELDIFYSHTRPDGSSCLTAFPDENFNIKAENIASASYCEYDTTSFFSPAEVVDSWMNSNGHRNNIMNANFDSIGVGYHSNQNSWTQLFTGKYQQDTSTVPRLATSDKTSLDLNYPKDITFSILRSGATQLQNVTLDGKTLSTSDYSIDESRETNNVFSVYGEFELNGEIAQGLSEGVHTLSLSYSNNVTLNYTIYVYGTLTPIVTFSIPESKLTIENGKSQSVNHDIVPSQTAITWTSSDTSIATVSEKGVVKAVGEGEVRITGKAGEHTVTCQITVIPSVINVTSIVLTPSSLSLELGESSILSTKIYPSQDTNTAVTWESSDTSVATVSNGTVIGKATGTATITATIDGKSDTCKVTVTSSSNNNNASSNNASNNNTSSNNASNNNTSSNNASNNNASNNNASNNNASNNNTSNNNTSNNNTSNNNTSNNNTSNNNTSNNNTSNNNNSNNNNSNNNENIVPYTSIHISAKRSNHTGQATITITPENASYQKVTWSVSKPDEVRINSAGKFVILTTDAIEFETIATLENGETHEVTITYNGTNPRNGIFANHSTWASVLLNEAHLSGIIPTSLKEDYTVAVTRGEIAEILVKMVEEYSNTTLPQASSDTFIDTSETYILKAYEAGIEGGITENTFSPEENATREQVALMIYKTILCMEEVIGKEIITKNTDLQGYSDFSTTSQWAKDAVAILTNNEIMHGTSETTLSPQTETTIEACLLLSYALFRK